MVTWDIWGVEAPFFSMMLGYGKLVKSTVLGSQLTPYWSGWYPKFLENLEKITKNELSSLISQNFLPESIFFQWESC